MSEAYLVTGARPVSSPQLTSKSIYLRRGGALLLLHHRASLVLLRLPARRQLRPLPQSRCAWRLG